MPYAHITGWGMAVPDTVLTNDELAQRVDTSDKWIREMTGIRERRIAKDREYPSTLAVKASIQALNVANLKPTDIDLIICATSSPEYIFPATACLIQDQLGASKAGAFDLSAACTGFIYALNMGAQSIRSGSLKNVLVIGTETLSRFVDWEDRKTCILFGDGAGAFVLAGQRHARRGALGRDAFRRLWRRPVDAARRRQPLSGQRTVAARGSAVHSHGWARGLPLCDAGHGARGPRGPGTGRPDHG